MDARCVQDGSKLKSFVREGYTSGRTISIIDGTGIGANMVERAIDLIR
jgi:hypothetical protein